ncbi:MAG: Eco57I restriction-modification methylase domain-containing protein [bacterium]
MNQYKKKKITRKFYNAYKRIHKSFTNSIEGIDNIENREWYSSVMLNRLMFLYFIQKEGFLDNDKNYLKNQLNYYSTNSMNYYDYLIKDLFYKALSVPKEQRTSAINEKVGSIPYINGGIFNYHILEEQYREICIDNSIFDDVYKFFEKYNWELDSKTFDNNEITPEIVGYIFEKYINRKEKGAYYTEKDTTDYITKYTIIPYILFEIKESFPDKLDELLTHILHNNPEKYFYNSTLNGVGLNLPDNIIIGYEDIENRTFWNDYTDKIYGLNTEIWRETIHRRQKYNKVKEKLKNDIYLNDILTFNLNIEKILYDIIRNAEIELLMELYYIIAGNNKNKKPLSILDPTCGSGAFLFSALNILEKIYEECINRMKKLSESQDTKPEDLKKIIKETDKHNNIKYYIYKSIIMNNLYGVDIMSEATEITRLRLLLKLFSLVESNNNIEPLPNINYNILSGNALVGFIDLEDIYDISKEENGKSRDILSRIGKNKKDTKAYLEERQSINDLLDKLLYKKYANDINIEFSNWKKRYKPFHWLVEFDDIMKSGGFDCIIGNPPYIEYYLVRKLYTVKDYITEKCGNISALITERSYDIMNNNGHLGFIAPISIISTPRMSRLRSLINNNSVYVYYSNFGDRPGTLFNGVHQKLNIILTKKGKKDCIVSPQVYTTNYYHWYSNKDFDERKTLFENINYVRNNFLYTKDDCLLKIGKEIDKKIWTKLQKHKTNLYDIVNNNNTLKEENKIYLSMRMTFWTKCFLSEKESNEFKEFELSNDNCSKLLMALFNSNLFFYYWELVSDCWHITNKELKLFKFDIDKLGEHEKKELYNLALELEKDLEKKKGYVGTVQTDYEYYHRKSKHIIDRIDKVLANIYNFTDDELDYIINYNIKYRMSNNL